MRGRQGEPESIEIRIVSHGGMRGRCSVCQRRAPGYDRLPERRWQFVPLWGIPTWFRYAPRRVQCAEHGVVVEQIPWSDGKRPVTCAMMGFLARWARRLSWRETAHTFQTSWESVYRSVEWFVDGAWRTGNFEGIEAIGVDEIHWGHGLRADNFLTVIYQIDAHCRRLLWVGKRRSEKTLRRGLEGAGTGGGQRPALCLQRHVEAVPECACGRGGSGAACAGPLPYHHAHESGSGRSPPRRGHAPAGEEQEKAGNSSICAGRYCAAEAEYAAGRQKLNALLASKLATARAWELKEAFAHFWNYKSVIWAGAFLDYWCERALRSRLEPMKKVARMLRSHEELLLNWFRAKGEISSGAVEGLNNKIRVVTRRSYGFRTYEAMEIALYHTFGRLPEPESAHRFC